MTTFSLLATGWEIEPTIVAGCAGLIVGYGLLVRGRPSRRGWLWGFGVLALAVALLSPLDALADQVSLAAHMIQHLLLMLVAAPLLVAGAPERPLRKLLERPWAHAIERRLGRPAVAWTIGTATLLFWHVPTLYDAALRSEPLHALEHLCLITSSAIFFWPVLGPLEERRAAPLVVVGYLLSAAFAGSILGLLITFAPVGVYAFYRAPTAAPGLLQLVRKGWGLTPAFDQQLGGTLMWTTGGPLYLGLALAAFARFYREAKEDPLAGERGRAG